MSKRANGDGSIFRRGDGYWVATLAHVDPSGRTVRKVAYGRTRTEARRKLDDMRKRLADGQPLADSRMTLAAWVRRWETTTLAASPVKQSTRDLYGKALSRWVLPHVGDLRLDRLAPSDVERMLLALADAGYSGQSRRTAYNVTRSVLATAVRDGLVRRNVAAEVRRPIADSREAVCLTTEQVGAVLAATRGHRTHGLIVTLAYTGLRIGEGLALRWPDVDLDGGTLAVTGTLNRSGGKLLRTEPKSARSRRTLPLAGPVVDAMKARRTAQLAERLAAGSAWSDLGYVFTTEVGTPLDPSNVHGWYTRTVRPLGVPGAFHALRLSAATNLMAAGVPLRVVADVLGHSSTRLTADTYSHVSAALTQDAIDRLAGVLGS